MQNIEGDLISLFGVTRKKKKKKGFEDIEKFIFVIL